MHGRVAVAPGRLDSLMIRLPIAAKNSGLAVGPANDR